MGRSSTWCGRRVRLYVTLAVVLLISTFTDNIHARRATSVGA